MKIKYKSIIVKLCLGLIITIVIFYYLFQKYIYKPRASIENAVLNFTSDSLILNQGEIKNIGFTLSTTNNKKISGLNLYFKFNLNNNNLLEFIDYSVNPAGYFNQELKKEVINSSNYGGSKILRLTLVTNKPSDLLVSSLTFSLRFMAKKNIGNTSVSLHASTGDIQNQIVGVTEGNYFNLSVDRDTTNIIVSNQAVCTQNSDCGSNALCNNQQCGCVTNFNNCDSNWNNGCESNNPCLTPTSTPTQTLTSTPTPTPTQLPDTTITQPSRSITLNLSLKFQGIINCPTNNQQIKAKIKLGGRTQTDYQTGIFSCQNGKWNGSVSFNVPPGDGYYLLVKGEKHIQKKICETGYQEAVGAEGTYRCQQGKSLTLNAGSNNLDLSGIMLMAGDLPEQNGVVNSYDTSLVRNNLGKTDEEALRLADINLDGRVNTQDYSLIIYALSVRTDEE